MTITAETPALQQPRALDIIAGYIASVAVAALTAAFVSANNDPYGAPFMAILVMGAFYIAIAGLPGFALTAALARRHGWSGWLPFTACGGLNVLLAWLLLGGVAGGPGFGGMDGELFRATLRAGVAGGVTYWWVAYHLIRR